MRKMKDSGVEWIGEIPASWKTNTIFQLFTQVKNRNLDLQEQNLLSLSYGKIKRKSIDTTDGLLPESFDGYNVIEANDIVLRLTDLQNDHKSLRVGLATERGIVTSAYLTIRNRSESSAKYLYYYLHSFDISKGFYGMGAGVRQGLNWDGIKRLKILTPSVPEQQRIVSFLDEKCFRIDSIIEKEQAAIEKLKEYKLSLITEKVTKGLDPNVKMKDSGVEWIGEIPVDWKIGKVSYFFNVQLGKMLQPKQEKENESMKYYLCAANLGNNTLKLDSLKQMWFSEDELKTYAVKKGDLLVVEGGDVASCAIVTENIYDIYFQNALHRVRPTENCDIRILKYLLIIAKKSGHIDLICNKATIAHFSKEKFLSLPYIVYPISEQQKIASFLDEKCSRIDDSVKLKEDLIEKLNEYKKSLIYEAVTGKREI